MIVDANSITVLKNMETPVSVFQVAGEYIDGEYKKSSSPETKRLIILPISGEEIKNAEPGFYTYEDKLILELGSRTLNEKDRFIFENKTFEITKHADYVSIANISKYTAKKVHDPQNQRRE
ncbi:MULTISPECIES: hypothetical protein [Leptospira]|uniref:hypothetical protein n=1 Tax=Leptospira TaxID=171 RepID=UPI0002BEECB0|nr:MULTISPECIES: hypothetical protein [Leptospira]EMK12875.1 hypothetical protein LEP1GSC066_1049 [Leptospira sp. serovar Kenya str. Sh9]